MRQNFSYREEKRREEKRREEKRSPLVRFILICFLNICLILFLAAIFNFTVYFIELKKGDDSLSLQQVYSEYKNFMTREIGEDVTKEELLTSKDFRNVENINSKRGSIVLFGCSNTYGSGLEENQTLSYKLAELTNRPVYNRGKAGYSVQHMLYQLRSQEITDLIKNPEYIIYVFYNGHYSRMTTPVTLSFPGSYEVFYKCRKGDFILKKRTFFTDKFIIPHYISNFFHWNIINRNLLYFKIKENLLVKYISASKEAAESKWKNCKFAVLFYSNPVCEETVKKLNELGIETITQDVYKINSDSPEYQLPDGHANAAFWEKTTPLIVDKLNLAKI